MVVPAPAVAGAVTTETTRSGGVLIVNGSAVEVPPPGAGANTLTGTVPEAARSAAEIAAFSVLASITVVGRLVPFHRTWENALNPLPVTVSVKADAPTNALAGDKAVGVGSGFVTDVSAASA